MLRRRIHLLKRDARECAARAEHYAWFAENAETEEKSTFDDKDMDIIFECNRTDLECRATILILQYSRLMRGNEGESREFFVRAVANCNKIVRNNDSCRSYDGHLWWRELLIDLMCLQVWQGFVGNYIPSWFKRGLLNSTLDSTKLMILLILRTLRHISLLLESMRCELNLPGFDVEFIKDDPANNRFEKSLLWETVCDAEHGNKRNSDSCLSTFAPYDGELDFPSSKDDQNRQVRLTPEEIERIRSGKDSFTDMTNRTVVLVSGVAKMVQSALAKLRRRQCNNEEFRNLLQQFVENSKVVHETKSPHGQLLKYVYPLCILADSMVAFRFRDVPQKQYASDAEKFCSSLKSLRTRMDKVVDLELVPTIPSCMYFL